MDVPGFALITGAAAGVALLDINHDALVAAKTFIDERQSSSGRRVCRLDIYTVDVTNEQAVTHTLETVAREFGRLDYVINAAGIAFKHEGGAAFARTSDWNRVLDINLTGTFFVLRAAAKIMPLQSPLRSGIDGRELQRGSIVNFSSIQGVTGIPLSTAYTVAKHGVLGLTRTASEDYAKDGLRINAICPGYTETPMTTEVRKAMEERIGTAVPMRRMGRPEEIADGVVYLSGGRSSFVTGTALSWMAGTRRGRWWGGYGFVIYVCCLSWRRASGSGV